MSWAVGGHAQTASPIMKSARRLRESLPAIGLGTFLAFDRLPGEPRADLEAVMRQFWDAGGRVVDTSPLYGMGEVNVGDLAARLGVQRSAVHHQQDLVDRRISRRPQSRAAQSRELTAATVAQADRRHDVSQPRQCQHRRAAVEGVAQGRTHQVRGRLASRAGVLFRARRLGRERRSRRGAGSLLDQRSRCRAAHPASGRGARHGRDGEHAVREGTAVRTGQRPRAPGLRARDRRAELGPVLPQVDRFASCDHLRPARDGESAARSGQHGRAATARCPIRRCGRGCCVTRNPSRASARCRALRRIRAGSIRA